MFGRVSPLFALSGLCGF